MNTGIGVNVKSPTRIRQEGFEDYFSRMDLTVDGMKGSDGIDIADLNEKGQGEDEEDGGCVSPFTRALRLEVAVSQFTSLS